MVFYQGNEDVPSSARLMKITAKTSSNKVSTIKLPDRSFTATGKGTLRQWLKENLHLDMQKCKMNRDNWGLARRVVNHSRIRRVLCTFKHNW
jgi:hypothetical protein